MAWSSPALNFSGSRVLISVPIAALLIAQRGQACPLPFPGLGSTTRGERAKDRPAPSRIDSLLQRASALRSPQQRHADQAVPLLEQAVTLAAASHDAMREAKALTSLAGAKISTAHHEEARIALRRARELAHTIGDAKIEMDAISTMGLLQTELGEYDDADATDKEALMLATAQHDLPARLRALNGLAAIAVRTGRTDDGVRYARQALQELDEGIHRGVTLSPAVLFAVPYNLAKGLSEQGEFTSAGPLFDRARAAAEQGGLIGGIWHVLHETGEMYRAQGELATAARYYERALVSARRMEAKDSEAMTLRALGGMEEARGNLPAALQRYRESFRIFEKAEFPSELPQTLTAMSRVQFLSGDRAGARATLDQAVSLLTSLDHPLALALEKLESGRQRLAVGAIDRASEDFRDAFAVAGTGGLRSLTVTALDGLGDAARAAGDLQSAARYYALAADAVDSMRASLPSIEQRAAFVAATHQTYERWLDTLVAAQETERAFLVAERERSRNLLEALRGANVARIADSRQQDLNEKVSALQIALAADNLAPQRRAVLLQRLDDSEHALDVAEARYHIASPLVSNLASAQRALTPREAFIAYAPLQGHVVIFVVTKRSLAIVDRPARDLGARASFFTDLLTGPDGEQALPAGRSLSHDLLADVLSHLDSRVDRLILSVAGELSSLPFGALPDPRRPAQPILARFEVAYTPSLAALAELRERRPTHPRFDFLGMAPLAAGVLASALPVYRSAQLGPLPSSGAEVKAIAREIRGHVDALIGDSASESALKQSPLDYKVLHFATHALIDPRFPARSAIVLARGSPSEDGWLQPREIYRLKMAAQLVVLSACETAAGESSTAEGIHSLARAFTFAGAKSVVGTLWKVEDRSAKEFVQEMYGAIADGQPVATALRTAQLRLAGEHPYRNARDWAGWLAAGDPTARPDLARPIISSATRSILGMAFFALLLGGVAVWMKVR
jgi:CHAT domain-containing protein/tetratricopeptide (TPR) repeat protein